MRPSLDTQVERWLGPESVASLRGATLDWYGPPIAVGRVPGAVYAAKGGQFTGKLGNSRYSQIFDYAFERLTKVVSRWGRRQRCIAEMAGFTGIADLISEATAGAKARYFPFQKSGSTGVLGVTNSLWRVGGFPPAGAAGSAAPGGRDPDDTTTGAFPFTNPASGDTQHFVTGFPTASVLGNTLLVYDRIFDVAKTMNSTATEAVTGVPSRYQSTTATDPDYVGGNFLFVEVATALAATAHNWTTCLYNDQANASSTLPSLTGNSSAIVDRLDHPTGQWFAPLEAGDVGIKALTQMQCSAAVATGAINFVIGHPIAFMPCPLANVMNVIDGINSAFQLTRIFDNAALAFLEIVKPAATATNYAGMFITVAG